MEITEEIFSKLKALQEVLVKKYEIEAKKAEAPKDLIAQEELLAVSQKEFIAKNAEYDAIKEKVHKIKFDLEQAVKLKESGEQGMDNITTHREYEALEKQINEAKILEADLRKELQKEEKTKDNLKETLKLDEENIELQTSLLNAAKDSLDEKIREFDEQLKELQAQEDEITPGLSDELLFKFERIIQRNTKGIVYVKDQVCNGCNMMLPSQFVNIVRKGDTINFCPYCSRILYYEESENTETGTFHPTEDFGSLSDLLDDDDEKDDEEYILDSDDKDDDKLDDSDDKDQDSSDDNDDADELEESDED